ncbi:MAG: hypothetical protein BGO21_07640 [Dyadobacter sp. 50-39]|nr:MAG: hypothetical protein BGO21_07640 [Dyadobacter sp. 50-39]
MAKLSINAIFNMKSLVLKQVVREFISKREVVTIEEIIEYLDHINKVRYSRNEVIKMLEEITNLTR